MIDSIAVDENNERSRENGVYHFTKGICYLREAPACGGVQRQEFAGQEFERPRGSFAVFAAVRSENGWVCVAVMG